MKESDYMEKAKQIEQCMTKQCDFCRRKGKCDREIEKEVEQNE